MAKVMRQIRRVKPKTEGLRGFWSNSWTQKCMAVMVFLALAWVHYQLAHLLISVKINNGQCQDCNLVKALPQQTLMMSHIIDDKVKPLRPVFMWGPIQGGIVHFNKARLDDTLLANLQRFQPDIPTAPQPVDFNDSAAIFAKDFSGLLLEKSAKTTRQPMPAAAPAVLLHAFYAQQGA